MPKCKICGKDIANPDSPGHINSKFHQDALLGAKAVDINLEPVKVPKPVPKKVEPKPEPKKVEPKKEPKKETPKPAPKKEVIKPKPTKETKPKVKTGGGAKAKLNGFQSRLKRVGYNDIFDDIAMMVGIWGVIITLINLFVNINGIIPLAFPGWTPPPVMYATAFADILYYILQLFMYSTLAIFPIYIKQVGMKIVKKWPESRLSFIRTEEDYRNFFLLIRYLCIFLFMFSAWTWYWSHAVSFFAMTIVMLGGTIRKNFM